jgi:DNA polymerase-1
MQHYYRLSGVDPVGTDYATGDGIATWDLREKQLARIEQEGLDYIYTLERRITRVVYRMQLRGIRIDRDELDKVQKLVDTKTQESRALLPPDLNIRSNKQVRTWIEQQGHTDAPYSPKGRMFAARGDLAEADKHRSYNQAYLEKIPPGRLLLDIRKYSTLGATFIAPLRDRHLRSDGKVHATYYQMATDDFGTVTGRFSASEPNLQQVPKRNKELGLPFRKVFIPEPGCRWLTADLSQAEPRLLAHYSGTKTLIEGYLASPPIDAHSAVTRAAGLEHFLRLPFKEAREYGKRLNQTLQSFARNPNPSQAG